MQRDELTIKSEAVLDVVKWLEKEIAKSKIKVETAKKDYRDFSGFEDCASSYERMLIEAETELNTLVSIKISTEKYSKKLKHMAKEGDV